MSQVDELRELLDRGFPPYSGRTGDWEDVLARTAVSPRARRRGGSPLVLLTAAVVALAVAGLLWPGGGGSDRVLERARAVANAGTVVHLVLGPEDAPMTQIELESGERRRLQSRHEQWFDPDRGVHDLHTIDGWVYRDVLYPAGSFPELEGQFAGLASAYRKALASGDASVGGKGTVDGREVYWIRFHVRYPAVGIPLYDAEHEVGVDAHTFEPRVWRSTEKNEAQGWPGRTTEVEIEIWETLPAGSGDFTAAINANALVDQGPAIKVVSRPRALETARSLLTPPPLWLGRQFRGLRLVSIDEQRAQRLETGAPIRIPATLDLCYGRTPDACMSAHPRVPDQPYVAITQANVLHRWHSSDLIYRPREGTIIVPDTIPVPGPLPQVVQGYARKNGVYATIAASNTKLLVAAARALRPIPRN